MVGYKRRCSLKCITAQSAPSFLSLPLSSHEQAERAYDAAAKTGKVADAMLAAADEEDFEEELKADITV